MTERLRELQEAARNTEVVDTAEVGVGHPVISGLYGTIFEVAGRIQPSSSSYEAA